MSGGYRHGIKTGINAHSNSQQYWKEYRRLRKSRLNILTSIRRKLKGRPKKTMIEIQNKNNSAKKRHNMYRAIIYIALGGKCNCCNEIDHRFLNIDHIKGGGRAEYKQTHGGTSLLKFIIQKGIPKDEYQLLCTSCNLAKHNKYHCPHQEFNIFDKNSLIPYKL